MQRRARDAASFSFNRARISALFIVFSKHDLRPSCRLEGLVPHEERAVSKLGDVNGTFVIGALFRLARPRRKPPPCRPFRPA